MWYTRSNHRGRGTISPHLSDEYPRGLAGYPPGVVFYSVHYLCQGRQGFRLSGFCSPLPHKAGGFFVFVADLCVCGWYTLTLIKASVRPVEARIGMESYPGTLSASNPLRSRRRAYFAPALMLRCLLPVCAHPR
nr:MAG TPA: hypothetical protein [Caudoviricetes sp.]